MEITIDGKTYRVPLDVEAQGADAIQAWLRDQIVETEAPAILDATEEE